MLLCHRCIHVRSHACAADSALRRHVRAPSASVDRVRLGVQAFASAKAFNADIGAWNTAKVTTLSTVCTSFGPGAARHCGRDALGGCSMRRGPLCAGGAAGARARVCVRRRVGTRMRGCSRVCV